ncbi:MAG: hypothetical protein L6R35_004078 [Caloplaca aegaea]|nr:MAG: hypothetical protein L6R35_004078 [Caloplaca aegaea]
MGNQTSAASRKQNDLSFHDETKEITPEGTEGSLSSQTTLKPTSIRGNRFAKFKSPRQASGSSTSSISTAISPTAKPVKMLETIGTDGAFTPKSEPYRLDLPVGTVSPPETSALSRGMLSIACSNGRFTEQIPPRPLHGLWVRRRAIEMDMQLV